MAYAAIERLWGGVKLQNHPVVENMKTFLQNINYNDIFYRDVNFFLPRHAYECIYSAPQVFCVE